MNNHIPKLPTQEEFDYIQRMWIINTAEGKVYSRYLDGEVGSLNRVSGYYHLAIARRSIRRSHLIWFGEHDVWPTQEIDHVDRDKTNDRIDNLRMVEHRENMANQLSVQKRDLPIGVHWNGDSKNRPFTALAMPNDNKQRYLGRYATVEEAQQAVENFWQNHMGV